VPESFVEVEAPEVEAPEVEAPEVEVLLEHPARLTAEMDSKVANPMLRTLSDLIFVIFHSPFNNIIYIICIARIVWKL
jgi:hypothetical protein